MVMKCSIIPDSELAQYCEDHADDPQVKKVLEAMNGPLNGRAGKLVGLLLKRIDDEKK